MDKLKNLLSGSSADKEIVQQPSGKLSGEGSHMPGSWDNDQDPGQLAAAKGSGITSDPAVGLSGTADSSVTPSSAEAAKGTGISSALGSDSSNYSPNVGSHMASSSGQTNPDSMAAATSALGGSPVSGRHANTTSPTASGQYSGSSAPGVAGQSVPHDVPSTSSTSGLGLGSGLGSSTTGASAPIADSFTSTQQSAYSSSGAAAPMAQGASATSGALTGQSLTDRSRGSDGNSVAIAPTYTERAQPLSGSTSDGTPANTFSSSGPLSGAGASSNTPAAQGSSSAGTTVSKPFPSDPVSTEPLGGSSHLGRDAGVTAAGLGATGLAAHEAGQYTGDSRDYYSGTTTSNTGLGSSNTSATGAYSGSSAPGVSGQSVPQNTGLSSSTQPITSQHQYGRDATAVGSAGALGTAAAATTHETHAPVIKDMRTGEPKELGSHGSTKDGQGSKLLNELDILPQPQESKFHNTTHSGHTAKDEYYGSAPADATSSSHTGRNVAAGVGAAAVGAGGVGAYEANKGGAASNTASGLGSGSTGTAAGKSSAGSGYGDSYGQTASGTPSGIADPEAALGSTSSSSGQGNTQTTSGSDHHYGRDAAAVAGIGGAGALGAHEYNKDRTSGLSAGAGQPYNVSSSDAYSGTGPTAGGSTLTTGLGAEAARGGAVLPTARDQHATATDPSTYTQQVATAEPPYDNKPYYKGDSPASHRDAAVIGGTGIGAAGLYEAGKSSGSTGLGSGSAGLASGSSGPTANTSSPQSDQYKHLADGTPSGIALSDSAHNSGLSSSNTQSSTGATAISHAGRESALAGGAGGLGGSQIGRDTGTSHGLGTATSSSTAHNTAIAGGAGLAATGAAAYGLSSHEKGTAGTSGLTNTAGTTGASRNTATGTPTLATNVAGGHGTDHSNVASGHYDDEPDSPTGTGETKKKRGFLSKLLHRDDPNKLHKDPNRKSLDVDAPRTTHDAYGSAEGGKATHIGTDGEIGRHGQAISGVPGTNAREALPLSEAERLAAQQRH